MEKLRNYKKNNLRNKHYTLNKNRFIILSILSILLVSVLLFGSTYSVFVTSNIDEDINVYQTGVLDVTYTLSEEAVTFSSKVPISDEKSKSIVPYRITVSNNGNVPYKFDLILKDTTATDVINYQYITTQVGKLEAKLLSDCTNNVIKEGIIVPAGEKVDIDVRIWLNENIQNTEIGKSFYGKLSVDGLAIYSDNKAIDNSILIAEYPLVLQMKIGSYVTYTGSNGCEGEACSGVNANSSDTSNGYCYNEEYQFFSSGWRLAYVDGNNMYITTAGASECLCTNSDGTTSNSTCSSYDTTEDLSLHISNLNSRALKYCNPEYASTGICDETTAWAISNDDYEKMMGSSLAFCYQNDNSNICGYDNDFINTGGSYWFADVYEDKTENFTWDADLKYIYSNLSNIALGVRPIIKLDSSVYVTSGTGTQEDPYELAVPALDERTYTVTFDANGGEVDTDSKIVINDSVYGELPIPIRENYKFLGWYTTKTGGEKITADQEVSLKRDQTLYARWVYTIITITFDPKGGTTSTLQKQVILDEVYGDLPEPTRTGYTFLGWYTAETEGEKITAESVVTTEEAQTLYAYWSVNSYTLTIDPNDGTYNNTTDNSTFVQNYDTVKNVGTPINPTGYIVTFDATGGSTDTSSLTNTRTFSKWVLSGSGQYVSATNPGYITSDITRTLKTDSSTGESYENFTYSVSGLTDNTYYSIRYPRYTYISGDTYEIKLQLRVNSWDGVTFSLRHSALANDHGTEGLIKETISATSASWRDITMTRTITGDTIVLSGDTVTVAPIFEIYTENLIGKTASADFDIKNMYIVDTTSDTLLQSNANLYLYRSGDGTLMALYDSSSITLPETTRDGYTFDGWYTAASDGTKIGVAGADYTPSASTGLYANWTANQYTVTFNANGGTVDESTITVTYDDIYNTLPTASKTGYTFAGWYTETTGGEEITSSTTVSITANQTLYAQWTPNQYTVSFNANGGSVSPSSISVTYASTYGELPTPTRTGYTFDGWFTAASGGTQITSSTIVSITNTQTLYAQWTSKLLADYVSVGDYVNYKINYNNVTSSTSNSSPSHTPSDDYVGWRVLSIEEGSSGKYVRLISAGVPMSYDHVYTTSDSTAGATSTTNLTTGFFNTSITISSTSVDNTFNLCGFYNSSGTAITSIGALKTLFASDKHTQLSNGVPMVQSITVADMEALGVSVYNVSLLPEDNDLIVIPSKDSTQPSAYYIAGAAESYYVWVAYVSGYVVYTYGCHGVRPVVSLTVEAETTGQVDGVWQLNYD